MLDSEREEAKSEANTWVMNVWATVLAVQAPTMKHQFTFLAPHNKVVHAHIKQSMGAEIHILQISSEELRIIHLAGIPDNASAFAYIFGRKQRSTEKAFKSHKHVLGLGGFVRSVHPCNLILALSITHIKRKRETGHGL